MIEINKNFKIEKIYAAGIFQDEKPTEFLKGFHKGIQAVFVLSGKLLVALGKNIYECKAGCAAIFKSDELNFIKLTEKDYTEYLFVSFSAFEEELFNLNLVTELNVLQKQLVLSISNIITANNQQNNLLPNVFLKDEFQTLKLASTVELLAVDIALSNKEISNLITRDTTLFGQAVAEMEKNSLGQISLETLSNKLGISLSHLKRIFSNFTDVGVHEYFMSLKIGKAIEMLQSGKTVTQTAELTGFNNQNYFSAAFKRITGTSAKEYCSLKKRRVTEKITVKNVKTLNETAAVEKKSVSDMPSYLL